MRAVLLAVPLLLLTACPETPPAGTEQDVPATDAVGRTVDDAGGAPMGKRPEDARREPAEGEGVAITGTISYPGTQQGTLRMDFVTQEGNQPPNLVHAATVKAMGEFQVMAPKDFGQVHIVAFIDIKGDGPTADDPAAVATVDIKTEALPGVILALSDTPDLGALTPGAEPPAPTPPPEGQPQGDPGVIGPPDDAAKGKTGDATAGSAAQAPPAEAAPGG